MRTTVTLDPNVHAELEAYARARHASFKQAINDVLRRGLAAPDALRSEPFAVHAHHAVFLPGVDPARLNQLLDELEVDDFVAEAAFK